MKFYIQKGYSYRTVYCEIDESVVASLKLDKNKSSGYIHDLELDESLRGKGMSKDIFSEMLKFIRERLNIDNFELDVDIDNIPAINLYYRLGFKVLKSSKDELKMFI